MLNENFSAELPLSPLHWMIADRECSIVVEQTADGLHVYDNPVGVMTNNPTFDKQLFHILGSVDQQRGCVHLGSDKYEITIYTSCCNLDRGLYYYNTYENHQITVIDMHKENLDSTMLVTYPLITGEQFCEGN